MNNNPLSTIPSQTIQNDDEIDLFELLSQFLAAWRWWVGGVILGGLLGLAAAFLIAPKYEAQGIVRLAQTGTPQSPTSSAPVESIGEAMARSQTLSFKGDVVNRLVEQKLLREEERDIWTSALLGGATNMRPVKDASLLEIKATARSKELAKGLVEAVAQTLAERHQPLVNERTEFLKKSLEQNRAALQLMEKRYGIATHAAPAPAAGSAINYLELARMSEAGTYATMRQRVLDLEAALQPPATRPTELMEAVAASDRPVSPKKSLLLAAGLVAGGFIGAVLGMGLPAWRRFQAQRKLPA